MNELQQNGVEANDRSNDNPIILRRHVASNETEEASEEKQAKIFMFISFLFLVCHLPRSIMNFYDAIMVQNFWACKNEGYSGDPAWFVPMMFFNNVFLVMNSSLNCAVYCVFSDKFRKQAKKSFNVCNSLNVLLL